MGKYDDIINLPHHVSKKHPQMSLEQRSAQFAPFAAVDGVEDDIMEAERVTEERENVSDEEIEILNKKLQIINQNISQKPTVLVTYYVPDKKKAGGEYVTITGNVKKIDEYVQLIILEDGTKIPIGEIVDIRSKLFNELLK